MPKVKICGITQPQQGRDISLLGADYIGVVVYPKSPRNVSLKDVRDIKDAISGNTKLVAVVVDPDRELVEELLKMVDIIQFHGNESLEVLEQFPKERVIKAFRIRDKRDLDKLKSFIEKGYTVLVDAYVEGQYGGTGSRLDVELLRDLVGIWDKMIVAGGLSDENVEQLLKEVKPFGLDASSRLEISPGIKDLEKVKRFIRAVKG
ncbi:MAG: phosphoribosylanthranilate isomerase [Hydrogenothermaceae bacterium]|nr:phosphoribosylanthranilate isomerase [Hydrogenothermaceae bacterium]